jgi:hypothetical protein
MRVQIKMASDWSTLPQAGKWRSKVRTSCTNESTSKPGICVPRIPDDQQMTWVWKYNEESRLQIGASSNCANICSRATFHARQNSPIIRPWSAQSCSTAVRRGCWPKERRTNCWIARIWEEGSPNDIGPENRKWCLQEKVQPRSR